MAILAQRFLANRADDVAKLHAMAAAGAFDEARVLGHNLKGTGLAYGFAGVSHVGAELEAAGAATVPSRIITLRLAPTCQPSPLHPVCPQLLRSGMKGSAWTR